MIMDLSEAMEQVDYHLLIALAVALILGLVGWIIFRSISYFFRPSGNSESSMTGGHKGGMGDGTGAAFSRVRRSGCETAGRRKKKKIDGRVQDKAFPFTQEIAFLFYILCGTVITAFIALYFIFICAKANVKALVRYVVMYFTPEIDDDDEPEVVKEESKEEKARRELAEKIERRRLARMKVEWERRKAKMQKTVTGRRLLRIREERLGTSQADELRVTLLKSRCRKPGFRERYGWLCFVSCRNVLVFVLFVFVFMLNFTLISGFILY